MKNTKIDFTGQTLSCGIDVHINQWAVGVVGRGLLLKRTPIPPRTEELQKFMQKHFPGATYNTVYEAGYCGFWIHRELTAAGIKNIVINPADVSSSNKEKRRKTDKVDCAKLARELDHNGLEALYVPSLDEESFRSLVRYRYQLIKDQTRTKNRIKSFLRFVGVDIPENFVTKHWSNKFIKYLSEIRFAEEGRNITLTELLDKLRFLRAKIVTVVKQVRMLIDKDARKQKTFNNLLSIPGIGSTTAITLLGELMNIERFATFEKLCGLVGFAPDTDSSGEKQKDLGLTIRSNRYMRSMLVESAWIAIKFDSALSMKFLDLCKRMEKRKAIIRIARKLLGRIMHVWKKDKKYIFSKVA